MEEDAQEELDWKKHEDEISNLIINEKKKLKEVMQHMESTHNFIASARQYKFRFSNLKNVKADEWVWIGQEIQRRRVESGKESVPCLLKRPLPEDRVARETARYKRRIGEALSLPALPNPAPDRISILTPSPIVDAPEANTDHQASGSRVSNIQTPLESSFLEALTQEPPLEFGMEMEYGASFNFDLQAVYSGVYMDEINWSEIRIRSPTPISIHAPNPLTSPQDLHQVSPFSLLNDFGMTRPQPGLLLLANLPWFRFQDALKQYAHNMNSIPSFPDSQHSTTSTVSVNLSIDIRRAALLGLVGSMLALPDHSHSCQPPPGLPLAHALVPERYEGELTQICNQILDPSTSGPSSLSLILSLAAYFASNNALDEVRMDNFVKWIIDQKCAVYLTQFLQINTSTSHAFAPQILKSAVRLQSVKLLTALMDLGVSFKSILPAIFDMDDLKFVKLAVSKAKPDWFTGNTGSRLLHIALRRKDLDLAQNLVDNGVDLNGTIDLCTALFQRVTSNDFPGVSFLLDHGVDVNKLSNPNKDMEILGRSPLAEAAWMKYFDIFTKLLENDASLDCFVYPDRMAPQTIVEWTSIHYRPAYLLIKTTRGVNDNRITIGDSVDAASRGQDYFRAYVERNQSQISTLHLEETLNESIILGLLIRVVVLLQYGVSTNHTGRNQPLTIAARRLSGNMRRTHCELLLKFNADVRVDCILLDVVDDVYLLQKLVESGANLDEHGPRALVVAAGGGHGASAAFLLDCGLDINTPGLLWSPLQAAAMDERLEMMEFLLGKGADVNAPAYPVEGRTALQAALESVNPISTTELLLDRGADVSAEPALIHGLTALEAVCHNWVCADTNRLAALCNRLLDAGAPINRPKGEPSFAIHGAILHGWDDILHRMLDPQRGAIINHRWPQKAVSDDKTKKHLPSWGAMTPLQLAAGLVRPTAIRVLLESGADVNEAPAYEFGLTALQRATSIMFQDIENVQLLLDKGAEINAEPAARGGITALQGAAIAGHITVAKLLIEQGAEVNAAPAAFEGRYAIEGAAEHGRLDMVQLLLNAGAKGNISRRTGFKFSIELAEKNEHFAIANLLKSYT
ncbi:hypothetical protein EDB81DRAFT_802046 [Dactylonectria macrodidyma]|uniref:Clr5 domain-containing protein n=1 Tax=Dactylonectria macrodidyma TaxID=307937 RepID=A0A9P9IWM6_9HYPO|nr:hypothetical protein EDB81DRAFT_802046 [Dactylonectria macrodidyma]